MGPISHRQVIYLDWFDEAGDAAIYRQDGPEWVPLPLPNTTPTPVDGLRTYSAMFSGAVELDESNWVARSFISLNSRGMRSMAGIRTSGRCGIRALSSWTFIEAAAHPVAPPLRN